jgi:hypothetical protein
VSPIRTQCRLFSVSTADSNGSPAYRIARILPTNFVAQGMYNASRRLGTPSSKSLDVGVVVLYTVTLFALSAWILHRPSAVAGAIQQERA